MLTFEQLQVRVTKSITIIRRPNVKHNLVLREFGKIAQSFGRWLEPIDTMCVQGCHHCCFRMPIIQSKLEFDYVEAAVKLKVFQTKAWMDKYYDTWMKFSKVFGPTNESTLNAWRGVRIPCPMLNDDRSCSIYANRPISCRVRWTPKFFITDCFPNAPLFPMMDGPVQASSYEISDPLIPQGPPKTPKFQFLTLVENTLKDIDRWTFNFEGKPRPLIETIGLKSGV